MTTVYTERCSLSIIQRDDLYFVFYSLLLTGSLFNRYFIPPAFLARHAWNISLTFMLSVLSVWCLFLLGQILCARSFALSTWLIAGAITVLIFLTSNERELIYFTTILSSLIAFKFIRRNAIKILIFISLLTCLLSMWGIAQFSLQKDLGLTFLGETKLSSSISGVAKFAINDTAQATLKVIRAYGPFPHANIFAGVICVGLVSALLVGKYLQSKIVLPIIIINALGILVSFSRSAWLSAFFAVILCSYYCSRLKLHSIIRMTLVLLMVTTLLFTPLVISRVHDPEDRALTDRSALLHRTIQMVSPTGIGVGNFEKTLRTNLINAHETYNEWEIAPVHNVPLLIMTEWGLVAGSIVGLSLLTLVIIYVRRNLLWLLVFAPLFLADHYLGTQISPLIFFVTLAIAISLPTSKVVQATSG